MRLKPYSWISWQVCALLALALVSGGAIGVALAAKYFLRDVEPLTRELQRRGTRIALLELLAQQSLGTTVVASLVDAPAPPALAAPAAPAATPAPVQAAQATASGTTTISEERKSAASHLPARAPGQTIVAAARPMVVPEPRAQERADRVVAPAPATAPAAPPSAEAQPVSGEELIAALKARVEGFAAEKAGVRALEKGAVHLRNGSTVRPGQVFPSGEKLLKVDPENNLVITNKRQMLLFFPEQPS